MKKEEILKKYLNNIKGSIAETLIKELFIENDFVVYDYGVEHLVPSFSPRVGRVKYDKHCKNSKVIRSLPDLLVFKNGKADYIEVKYRAGYWFEDIDEDYSFKSAYFIIVKKEGLFIGQASEIMESKKYCRMLENNVFNLSKESIQASEDILKPIFKSFSDLEKNKTE